MSKKISTIDELRDQDLRAVLGQKKLSLVLDLDNTLLHTRKAAQFTLEDKRQLLSNTCELYEIDHHGSKLLVKLRPGAGEFLKKAHTMFQLSVYTMGTRSYAHRMVKLLSRGLNQDGPCPSSMFGNRIISREDCTEVGQKGLDVVLSDARIVLIVDDREDVWEDSCRANIVKIDPYHFFGENGKKGDDIDDGIMDDEFRRVLTTLTLVHQVFYEEDNNEDGEYMKRDVRVILENIKKINEALK